MFQHTAARRRLAHDKRNLLVGHHVSTHSRPKAAGPDTALSAPYTPVSTHSRPKAAGDKKAFGVYKSAEVSTHSRPKAAGRAILLPSNMRRFQHTAARRRLERFYAAQRQAEAVSTHSRPKAAGYLYLRYTITVEFQHTAARRRLEAVGRHLPLLEQRFNTQPPEGGWAFATMTVFAAVCFNTQPPEGGWAVNRLFCPFTACFNTQPPEGGWHA